MNEAPAILEIHCPAAAVIVINQVKTSAEGSVRRYRSPMPGGIARYYEIIATIESGDVTLEAKTSAVLRPGVRKTIALDHQQFKAGGESETGGSETGGSDEAETDQPPPSPEAVSPTQRA